MTPSGSPVADEALQGFLARRAAAESFSKFARRRPLSQSSEECGVAYEMISYGLFADSSDCCALKGPRSDEGAAPVHARFLRAHTGRRRSHAERRPHVARGER